MDLNELIQIEGTVASLIYKNSDSGYAVFRLASEERGELTAVGILPFIAPGEEITAYGVWVVNPQYGEQFSIQFFERSLPQNKEGILTYLASGAVRGIGPRLAARLIERFEENTLEVLLTSPESVAQIKGITEKRAHEICDNFAYQHSARVLMELLVNYHIQPQIATKLLKNFGSLAMKRLEKDPYLLCRDEYGADFELVDTMRGRFAIEKNDMVRIHAGILYELMFNLQSGHAFIPQNKLIEATADLLEVGKDDVAVGLSDLGKKGEVCGEEICSESAVYLSGLYIAETLVAQKTAELLKSPSRRPQNLEQKIRLVMERMHISYVEKQIEAVKKAVSSSLFVLTGGPGTGKTTTVRLIIEVFEELGLQTVLAAPTGRAAKRLIELCGKDAKTIHRLLETGFDKKEGILCFKRNAENPLEADVLIVDEASMIDIVLMKSLMEAMKRGSRLILVGDPDQLPPVGPGNLLHDFLDKEEIPSLCLEKIFRQAESSAIVRHAHSINEGKMPDLSYNFDDFYFIRRRLPQDALEAAAEMHARITQRFGIPKEDIQVITPSRQYEGGALALNAKMQETLNPPREGKKELRLGNMVFREGDRVMQTKNNYDLIYRKPGSFEVSSGVFNGDIGTIECIDLALKLVVVRFDDKVVEYAEENLLELELAYALTVHKAQGSEFQAVILVLSKVPSKLLVRNLLYTAFTRARDLLIVIGDDGIMKKMVTSNRYKKRYGALKTRIEYDLYNQ